MHVLVDQAACLRRGGAHDALDDARGQFLQHVDRVVHVQLFDDPGQLRVRDGVDDAFLLRGLEVCENVGCGILGEQAEDHRHAGVLQLREELRQVVFVHGLHAPLQFLDIAAVEQRHQFCVALFLYRLVIQSLPVFVIIHGDHPGFHIAFSQFIIICPRTQGKSGLFPLWDVDPAAFSLTSPEGLRSRISHPFPQQSPSILQR